MFGSLLLKRLSRRVFPQAIILIYHRVSDDDFDPQLLCVSLKNFAEHMRILRSAFRPCSLGSLTGPKHLNLFSPQKVVVTFDDGYADNLLNAKPILRQFGIPATVFVTTGFIGANDLPYWDELSNLFLESASLPSRLKLSVKGETKIWEFSSEPPVDKSWNLLQESNIPRQDAYKVLCDHLRSLNAAERKETMSEIRTWSGKTEPYSVAKRFMTHEELGLLTVDSMIEIGAHTISHPSLAALPEEEQRFEIVQGKFLLEEMSGRKVCSFAYPYGGRENFTPSTVRIIKEAGFESACSNFGGTVNAGTDRYQLPRILIRNWSGDEFFRNIESCFR